MSRVTKASALAARKPWVIDASVTRPWLFADEATPFTEQLLDAVGTRRRGRLHSG